MSVENTTQCNSCNLETRICQIFKKSNTASTPDDQYLAYCTSCGYTEKKNLDYLGYEEDNEPPCPFCYTSYEQH
jgi:hypothetical protein